MHRKRGSNVRFWARLLTVLTAPLLGGLLVPGAANATGDYHWYGAQYTSCSKKLTMASAYAAVQENDHVIADVAALNVPTSTNDADYLDCVHASGIKVGSMRLWNNYTISGVKIDNCSVGFPSGFNCTISGTSSVLTDTNPAFCTNCSHLDADQNGIAVTWQTGAVTHYVHQARTVFRGTNGSTITVTATIDRAP